MSKEQWIKENLKPGEHYAGIILGKDGQPDHHLILLPGEAESVSWPKAVKWAVKAGGELPTRCEQALLYANIKEQFQLHYYWSNEQHALNSDYAWGQVFANGLQYTSSEPCEDRARAVRRIFI